MKSLVGVIFYFSIAIVGNTAELRPVLVGHYSNQKISGGDDPHILSGYYVSIYRCGAVYFGDIEVGNGSAEARQGTLKNLVFDPVSKAVHFEARYSAGIVYSKDPPRNGIEALVDLTFSGRINSRGLAGVVVEHELATAQDAAQRKAMLIRRVGSGYVPRKYVEWQSMHGATEVDGQIADATVCR